jgi:hypothetical protein
MEIAFVTPFGAKGDNIVIDKKNPKNIKAHADLNSPNIPTPICWEVCLGWKKDMHANRLARSR